MQTGAGRNVMKKRSLLAGRQKKEENPYQDLFKDFGGDALECNFESTAHIESCEEIFLNRFTEDDIRSMLHETGLTENLNALGYSKLHISIDLDEGNCHHLSIFHSQAQAENLLINLRLSEILYRPEVKLPLMKKRSSYNMVNIEWAQAASPARKETPGRSLLPGQQKPGLGILSYLMLLMKAIGARISSDGFMETPDHFHLALMYSKTFRFFDPAREAQLQGIMRDLGEYDIADLAWGFTTGTIIETRTGKPAVYTPSAQAFPLTDDLKRWFDSSWYRKHFNRAMGTGRYSFQKEKMEEIKNELLKKHKEEEL